MRADEARIRVRVRGPRGRQLPIDAVIDTGFNGWLTLPPALVASLGLSWQTFIRAVMADGREDTFNVYEAKVLWDRRRRSVPVTQADSDLLVGMPLLEGSEVNLRVHEHGLVTIKRLA